MKISYFEFLLQEFLLYCIEGIQYDKYSYQFYSDIDWMNENIYAIMIDDDSTIVDVCKIRRLFEWNF